MCYSGRCKRGKIALHALSQSYDGSLEVRKEKFG
jgi:hypothetical protein